MIWPAMRKPRRLRKRHHDGELRAVVDEAVALFWRVRYVADQIHTTGGRSETARGVLRGLVRYGARTVPQLAFARSVTGSTCRRLSTVCSRMGSCDARQIRHMRARG